MDFANFLLVRSTRETHAHLLKLRQWNALRGDRALMTSVVHRSGDVNLHLFEPL